MKLPTGRCILERRTCKSSESTGIKHAGSEHERVSVMVEIEDRSLMMIILLEECNFACAHCLREYEPMAPGYKLKFEQLQLCLADCRKMESISWVHFTGGEPTLWTEGNRSLIDLLLEIAKRGFTPGFTTNGSLLTDYSRCRDFLAQYFNDSSMPLRIYFSIDTFHRNFNPKVERARSLDNVIECMKDLPQIQADLLDLHVITVVSKDYDSLLPEGMIRYYESRGVSFGFVPLMPLGRAESFRDLCPDLDSRDPEDLGAYRSFYKKKSPKREGATKDRQRANFINLIGSDYYFTNPWRKVARLGNLPDEIIRAYLNPTRDL